MSAPRFVKVTPTVHGDTEALINVDGINKMMRSAGGTRIWLRSDPDGDFAVTETPEEILAAIAAAERTAVPEEVTEEAIKAACSAFYGATGRGIGFAIGLRDEAEVRIDMRAAIEAALRVMREGR